MNYCFGCKKCYSNGECVQKDKGIAMAVRAGVREAENDLIEKHQKEIQRVFELGKDIGGLK